MNLPLFVPSPLLGVAVLLISKLQFVHLSLSLDSIVSLSSPADFPSFSRENSKQYPLSDTQAPFFTFSDPALVMETMLVPPWLEPLLTTAFFSVCRTHGAAARSECNMYCLDCNSGAFCFYCRSSRHKDHRVIQIRRSSYHDVVRVTEIQRVLDIGGVQTYVINSARVLFLNERPQPKSGKGVAHICEICGRSLLDTFRFCSLGCKLVGVKRNGDATFVLGSKNGEEREGISSRRGGEEELREGSQQDIYPPTPSPPTSSNARRRKGIPRRAPLGT